MNLVVDCAQDSTEDDLIRLFSGYGKVLHITRLKHWKGACHSSAVVRMEEPLSTAQVIRHQLHGMRWHGCRLKIYVPLFFQ